MDNETINNLKEALSFSPENIPLRLHLADALFKLNRLEEAETEYNELLNRNAADWRVKHGLAKVYYKRAAYSTCNVILEALIDGGNTEQEVLLLHARALLKEHLIGKAQEVYKTLLSLYPTFTDAELDEALRMPATHEQRDEDDEEDEDYQSIPIENYWVMQKPEIGFADVGGMDKVKKEIELKILKPLLHPELYKAYGKKIGGGILLYGPPGCGKTYIAKATAGEVNATFITIGLNDILDMWIGNSEKNLNKLFELARRSAPCVLFIDEIDALGASRSDMKHSASRSVINQFLMELDGVQSDNEGVLIIGATNAPWSLDAAFRRPGRFDRIVFVPPPDQEARQIMLELKLRNKPTDKIDFAQIAAKTNHFSGADIDALIDIAIEAKLEAAFMDGIPKPLATKDLMEAIKKHKPSTQEWFSTAKNFALFANDSGLYDDILNYMDKRK